MRLKWFFVVLYRKIYASFFTCKECIHAYDGQCMTLEDMPFIDDWADCRACEMHFERRKA